LKGRKSKELIGVNKKQKNKIDNENKKCINY
jgi:hypothetical protein